MAALSVIAAGAVSCTEETIEPGKEIPGIGGNPTDGTELDQWLHKTFIENYNIDVVYRWDAYEISSNSQLVPVIEMYVQPMMDMIAKVWFEPYESMAGRGFIQEIAPKKVVLVGSAQYNSDGSKVLGQAEGGRKITLFDCNSFSPSDEEWVREVLHTIEHEFAHILHQTKGYGTEFREICAGYYSATGWQNYSETDALLNGFYSNYAMSGVDEDFVETISLIMVYGPEWRQVRLDLLDQLITYPPGPNETPEETAYRVALASMAMEAKSKLLAKEAIVSEYLEKVWGVRFFDDAAGNKGIITLVQEAITGIVNGSTTNP